MVRNVKSRKGFSVVEILVSMVILAIVVMIMTHIIAVTTKSQGKANSDDIGDAIALEYLAKLQNKVKNTKTGNEQITRDNISFNVRWDVDDGSNGLPSKATVTVTWNSASGAQSSEIIGYVDLTNVCSGQNQGSNGNQPITGFTYKTATVAGTNVTWSSNPINFPASVTLDENTASGTRVAWIIPQDGNYPDHDKMTWAILNSQDRFVFVGDTIKTARAFTQADSGTYKIRFQAFDCSGANPTQKNTDSITIIVRAGSSAPVIRDTTFAPISEIINPALQNITTNFTFNSCPRVLNTTPSNKSVHWYILSASPKFTIEATGDAPQVSLLANHKSLLSYEASGGVISVRVGATYDGMKNVSDSLSMTRATLKFPLTDVPEMPKNDGTYLNAISLTNTGSNVVTIPENLAVNSLVCKLFIDDEDLVKPNYLVTFTPVFNNQSQNNTMALDKRQNSVDGSWEIYVKNPLPSNGNNEIKFKLGLTDNDVSGSNTMADSREFKVTLSNAGQVSCTGLSTWSFGSAYTAGAFVKYSTTGSAPFMKFRALSNIYSTNISSKNPPATSGDWIVEGNCQ